MSFQEECLRFACAGSPLQGVLTRPHRPTGAGLVIVVGGPQYRVGSHRQFVRLARHLASAGHATLRFDYRGMGDSGGNVRNFESVSEDIEAALNALREAMPDLRQVALWGLCDGASAALLYLHDRPHSDVAGLCLINPWVRSPRSQAAAQVKLYYAQRLAEREFWLRLLKGQIGFGRLGELLKSLGTMLRRPADPTTEGRLLPFQQRMAAQWHRFGGPLLLILSGADLIAREFLETVATDPAWRRAMDHPRLQRIDLQSADHTFSDPKDQSALERATCDWMDALAACGASPASP